MKTAIALWCIVAVGCKQSPVIQQSSGYATMTVFTSEKTLSNNYSASIRGKQDIDIYPQVSGFITKLCVAEGESVKKGQVLFIIDQVPYQAALNTAIANVEAAKASVATAQLTYESKQELYKNKVVSEFDLKTAYNTLLSAKAQLAQAEAQEVNARNNLSYTEVKSPSNGVIGTLPYRVGALVSASLPAHHGIGQFRNVCVFLHDREPAIGLDPSIRLERQSLGEYARDRASVER